MIILRLLLIQLLLLSFYCGLAQQHVTDLSTADSVANSVKYKNDIYALTKNLVSPFSEDLLKTRAIFKWITNNISYRYKYYNRYAYKGKDPKTYRCRDDEDCASKKLVWETRYINTVLRKKKGICAGYAMLFKKMCDIAGIKSAIIPGYVRTEYYQVGTAGTLDHAWNAVWIESAWHLLDATWATGGCARDEDGKLLFFRRNYDNYYWLTPAADFARNHYPQDSSWVLIPGYTKDSFSKNPYYAADKIPDIRLIAPSSGIIAANLGDTIRFKIKYARQIEKLQINSNTFRNPDVWVFDEISKRKKVRRLDTIALKKQQYIPFKKKGDVYEFEYVVADSSLYYLELLFDKYRVMRFKVDQGK